MQVVAKKNPGKRGHNRKAPGETQNRGAERERKRKATKGGEQKMTEPN
jgi:hypothetical protein